MRPEQADQVRDTGTLPANDPQARWRMPYAVKPKFIQLETVTKCNARCPFCPQNEIVRDPARMPAETWMLLSASS